MARPHADVDQTRPDPDQGDLNTVDEAAARLGVHAQTVRNWIRNGELGYVRLGRAVRITDAQLASYIASRTVEPELVPPLRLSPRPTAPVGAAHPTRRRGAS